MGIQAPPQVSSATLKQLSESDWPGNVRELENAVERALIQHRQGPLTFLFPSQESSPEKTPPQSNLGSHGISLDSAIRSHIEEAVAITNGKINGPDGAAFLLDVHPNTLRNRMKKLGIKFGRQYRKKPNSTVISPEN